ncbi:MAG: P-loop NTPase [Candidatus Methanomethylicia archaeon]
MDPRIASINNNVRNIKNVIAIVSGKGGVGKSIISTLMAIQLAKMGYKVGLLDTDFTSPSTHVILGVKDVTPIEDKGIIPPEIYGIKYMSITYYTQNNPIPLRGKEISNALMEILTITKWKSLDYLVIDAPPGISDIILDMLRIEWNIKFIIVTTPSKLAMETVNKLIKLLLEQNAEIIGIIVNMVLNEEEVKEIEKLKVKILSKIPFQYDIEKKLGDIEELIKTEIFKEIQKITLNLSL